VLVFIDAPALVEEDAQRVGSSPGHAYGYDQWMAIPGGPVEFIKSFGIGTHRQTIFSLFFNTPSETRAYPVILFTHIPLWRPDGTSCGSLREKGGIKAGTGFGYQNTIGKEATEFVLETIKPSIVFRCVQYFGSSVTSMIISPTVVMIMIIANTCTKLAEHPQK
jgi:ethanolamine phosphate phosphodiesterase